MVAKCLASNLNSLRGILTALFMSSRADHNRPVLHDCYDYHDNIYYNSMICSSVSSVIIMLPVSVIVIAIVVLLLALSLLPFVPQKHE